MTDLIFVTDNPAGWHEENFKTNKHHYSMMMRLLGPRGVALVQDIKPYCFFNPFVEVDGVLLKYGVISETHLLKGVFAIGSISERKFREFRVVDIVHLRFCDFLIQDR